MIITQAPLAASPTSLPNGQVGVPYSQQLTPSGGAGAPYTFADNGVTLPPGLSIDAAGLVSGTPTTAGTFSVTIKLTDKNGQQVFLPY